MQVAIVLYQGMTTLDALGPYEILRFLPDVDLRFVSNEPGPIVVDSGFLILAATHSFAETPAPDLIVVPGSEAHTPTAMADLELISWLKAAHETTTWTTSVCSGALILAAAGLLDGRPATTHWIAQSALKPFGALPQRDKRMVQSGKIVTAAGVSAGLDMALWLVGQIEGEEHAEVTQLLIEYDPQPAYDAGHPSKASAEVYQKAKSDMINRAKNPKDLTTIPKIIGRTIIDKVRKSMR